MRILLAGMSNMLTEIIRGALEQALDPIAIDVVGSDDDLDERVRIERTDAVVMQDDDPGNFEHFRSLFQSFPMLKIIGIARDGRFGFVHELQPHSRPLVELSAANLASALRPNRSCPSLPQPV